MKLTETAVKKQTSAQSLDRGYTYYRNGYVQEVVRRGTQISGSVEGSNYEPYRVQITLGDDDIASANCSCPYDWGGYCKHIAAVLLYCIHEADNVEEKPALETVLADLSAHELRQVIMQVAGEFTGLMNAIEREIEWLKKSPTDNAADTGVNMPAVDINAIRRELAKDFDLANSTSGGYDSWGEYEAEIYPDDWLSPHLNLASELLDAGAAETAAAVITAVIETWLDGMDGMEEWIYEYNEDPLYEAASEIAIALAESLLSMELTATERAEWQKRIAYWENQIPSMEIATTAVNHGWEYPPLVAAMQGNITNKGVWGDGVPRLADELTLARLRILARQERYQEYIHLAEAEGQTGLYVNMLAQIGEVETAVSQAKKYIVYPNNILRLAQILNEQGKTDAALDIAAHGLTLEDSHKTELSRWLREQAKGAKQSELALKAAQTAFTSSFELSDYKAVKPLAGDQWAEIKPKLLKQLAQSNSMHKTDIYLHEKMLIEAMKLLDKRNYYGYSDLDRVIAATKEKYPDWGIAKCKKQAEAIMDAGKAKNYDTAVSWLRKARDIYLEHDRRAEWNSYLSGVLGKHQRKYKLVPMLKAIR